MADGVLDQLIGDDPELLGAVGRKRNGVGLDGNALW
jgi:hypothetical protein